MMISEVSLSKSQADVKFINEALLSFKQIIVVSLVTFMSANCHSDWISKIALEVNAKVWKACFRQACGKHVTKLDITIGCPGQMRRIWSTNSTF